MTKRQKEALARFCREHAKFFADLPGLESIFYKCAETMPIPKKHLAEPQRLPTATKILAKLESSPDDAALIEVFQIMSRGKLPN